MKSGHVLKKLKEKASDYLDMVFLPIIVVVKKKLIYVGNQWVPEVNKCHKFIVKGHTQNEGDSAHSLIQRNISSALKSSPIYVQYITLIKTAKKKGTPFLVHELTHERVLDIKPLTKKMEKK